MCGFAEAAWTLARWYNEGVTRTSDKLQHLQRSLTEAGHVAIAFSGGTDSAFLTAFAHAMPEVKVRALTVASPLMPVEDMRLARAFCQEQGIPHEVHEVDLLSDADIRANTPKRCYLCKRKIMGALKGIAEEKGAVLCDGSNADDAHDIRPGERALQELGILSPLADAGLTKAEIRDCAHTMGVPQWDKPASACLASRVPFGCVLDEALLCRIANAEACLRERGFRQVRVRAHGDVARIEVPSCDLERLMQFDMRKAVSRELHSVGFAHVSVDMDGYRMGSLNEGVLEGTDG